MALKPYPQAIARVGEFDDNGYNHPMANDTCFIGVDVGGTKILAALVRRSGQILCRHRVSTPRGADSKAVLATIIDTIARLIEKSDMDPKNIGAIGLAVPGVVDFQESMVAAAPNITVSGEELITPLRKAFDVKVALANDTDAAVLGERWLGSARQAYCAVGLFVGTGLGGGVLVNRTLVGGSRFSAGEIGHTIIDRSGPMCACGMRGCLEALVSRTAIEREIAEAVARGEETVLTELRQGDTGLIRSGLLARALEADDALVKRVLGEAAEALGLGCISLRHIFEPDVVILGGGVAEACGDFILPIVERVLREDPLSKNRPELRVVLSALSDDAGVLGAAALAMNAAGVDPFEGNEAAYFRAPSVRVEKDEIRVGKKKSYSGDFLIRVSGKSKRRSKDKQTPDLTSVEQIGLKDLKRACKGGPEILLIVRPDGDRADLPQAAATFLRRRAIQWRLLDAKEAMETYAELPARKALLVLRG
jgi:glucokinase